MASTHQRAATAARYAATLCAAIALTSACSSDDTTVDASKSPKPTAPWKEGAYPAGHTTHQLTDAERKRTVSVEVWYPADPAARDRAQEGAPLADFESKPAARKTVESLAKAAPSECVTAKTRAARDAAGAEGEFPLLVFSHCLGCGRYTSFSVAEHLARHGFIVAAPDHAGPVPFDPALADGEPLDLAQLEVRTGDLKFVLDEMLGDKPPIPKEMTIDAERVGAYGHSFGSVTVGNLMQTETRVKAGVGIFAPMQNPLLPGVDMANIKQPLLLLLAQEDNSIQEIGNGVLRANFKDANKPVTKIEIADAGHWSTSDLCGIVDGFKAGCGSGTRHSEGNQGEMFDYIPVQTGIDIVRRYVASFFVAELNDDEEAAGYVSSAEPKALVTVEQR